MSNAQPLHPSTGPALSGRAARLLAILARDAMCRNWALLDVGRAAAELGIRNSELLALTHELEDAALVECWPLGSLVYLTDAGRALATRFHAAHP